MSADPDQRRLSAIMFTDMVGYSALSQRDEALAQELLEEHRALLRALFPRFHGHEIKTIGDAFLVEFASALEAAQCAIEIQRVLSKRNHDVGAGRRIELKIGIHLGDVIHRDGDVYGDGINIASRIEPLAGAGGICVSIDVERQIRSALGLSLQKLALTDLKNISVPMELFRVVLPWASPATAGETGRLDSSTSRKPFLFAVAAAGVAAIALVGWWLSARSNQSAPSAANPTQEAIAAAQRKIPANAPPASVVAAVSEKSIAVLPFANLSSDKDSEYFTDGVHEDLLTALAKVRDLNVISRTSVLGYRDLAKRNLRQIAAELGVANVLEGSVRRAGGKARITVQLIDARTDQHRWAETYDRDLADVFAVQTEVAREITNALQANLTAGERSLIARRPTKSQDAYDVFLRARALQEALSADALRSEYEPVVAAFEQAIALDPDFALAQAQLSVVHGQMYWFGFIDPSPERRALALKSLEAARRLAPDAPETRFAEGAYAYLCENDWERALAKFTAAERDLPNDAQLQARIGFANRRIGRWPEALERLTRSAAINPRDASSALSVVETLFGMRRYAEARDQATQLGAAFPKAGLLRLYGAQAKLAVDHDWTAYLKFFAEQPLPPYDSNGLERGYELAMRTGDLGAADRFLADARYPISTSISAGSILQMPIPLTRAELALLRGDAGAAAAHAREAMASFENGRWTQRQNSVIAVRIAQARACSGRDEDVRQLLKVLQDTQPRDTYTGSVLTLEVARTVAALGRRAEALELLRLFVAAPCEPSAEELRHDPYFAAFRDDPRFEEVLRSEKRF